VRISSIQTILCGAFVVAGVLCTAVAMSQTSENPKAENRTTRFVVPRTEYGQPDLRGVWNYSSDTPLQRPPQYKDREFLTREEIAKQARSARELAVATDGASIAGVGGYNQFWMDSFAQSANPRTSLIIDPPDGRLPPTLPGVKLAYDTLGPDTGGERPVRVRVGGIRKDGPEDRGLSERCLMGYSTGPPFMPSLYNNVVQIFQSKTHAVILTEMIHDARIVPLDDRPPLDRALQQWSGDSRGHWEGDTLIVETRNFTDKTQSFAYAGTGATLHLVERFTRVGPNRVDYQFTVDDPVTFTKPITVLVPMVRSDGELYEYACHEGNYGMVDILSGARVEEAKSARK
jgi:hypothetical protein